MLKQKRLIIILAVVVVVLLGGYFVADRLYFSVEEPEQTTAAPETEAGEQLGTSNRYLMFPQIERSGMQSIEVHNSYGSYKFAKDENGDIQIDGFTGTLWNAELFSQLMIDTGYTLSKVKVEENVSAEKIEEYGLDPETNPDIAYFIITDTDGNAYKVYVGYETLTFGGYYCMLEGRDSIYMLGDTLGTTVLRPIEDYVSPVVTTGISTNTYFYIDKFIYLRGEDTFMTVRTLEHDEQFNPDALVEHQLVEPAAYTPSDSTYYEALSILAALSGESTVKLGVTEDDLVKYGLSNPAHTIYFTFTDPELQPGDEGYVGELEYLITFSELRNGYYYALSPIMDIIVAIPEATVPFLKWELINYIEKPIFQVNINNMQTMTVASDKVNDTFHLSGEGQELVVVSDAAGQFEDVYNFRQFYKTLLTIQIEDYAMDATGANRLTDDEITGIIAKVKPYLTYTYTMRNGETTEIAYYMYTTRKALVTINGKGEFYALADMVEKVENDAIRVIAGEAIDSSGKN